MAPDPDGMGQILAGDPDSVDHAKPWALAVRPVQHATLEARLHAKKRGPHMFVGGV